MYNLKLFLIMGKLEKMGVIIFTPDFYEKMKKTSADFFNYLKSSAVGDEIKVKDIFKQDSMSPFDTMKKDTSQRGQVLFRIIDDETGETITVIEFHKSGRLIAYSCGDLGDELAIDISLFKRNSKTGVQINVVPDMIGRATTYVKLPRNEVFRLDFVNNKYQVAGVRFDSLILNIISLGQEAIKVIKAILDIFAVVNEQYKKDVEAELAREAEFKNFV